MLKLNQY